VGGSENGPEVQRVTRFLLAFTLLLVGAFALQEPVPIPPFEGDGNSQHDGQPQWCQSKDEDGFKANCSCMPAMSDPECKTKDGGDTYKCGTYCRHACKCRRECQDTR
jgi:hypothetical protein